MTFRPTHALTRGIPATFATALVQAPHAGPPIDVERARAQHAAYVAALEGLGLAVAVLPPDDAHPDACFVEDCAVIAAGRALLTRPGAPSRLGEVQAIATALAPRLPVTAMEGPATLDGGDVLRSGDRLYVGRSGRTNPAGVAALRATFEGAGLAVVEVPVAGMLHLKCAASALDAETLLVAEGAFPAGTFADRRVIAIPAAEAYAANVVVVGRTALVADGHPHTRAALEAHGYEVVALDVSEIRKADGSLTCLSILFGAG